MRSIEGDIAHGRLSIDGVKKTARFIWNIHLCPLFFSVQSARVAPGQSINRIDKGFMSDLQHFCTLFCTILLLVIETRLTAIF